MAATFAELAAELSKRKIRASHQRIKILQYLENNRCHPTVDQIYSALHPEIPSLSKTTIYNTLTTFLETGLVRALSIGDNETRFDITIEDHGHFKCEACGTIYNFAINMDSLTSRDLSNFKIQDKNVYFKGICPGCLSDIKEAK